MENATQATVQAAGNGRMLRLLAQSRQGIPQQDHAPPAAGPDPGALDGIQLAHQPAGDGKG